VFCNTKAETELVARGLQNAGYRRSTSTATSRRATASACSGLREERVEFLVATDVAARGIDVPHLSHVVHFGFPESPEAYVHRSGRTGRAGRTGTRHLAHRSARHRQPVPPAAHLRHPPHRAKPPLGARRIDVHGGSDPGLEPETIESEMGEVRVAVGRRDGARGGDLARLVRDKAGIAPRDVGSIKVYDRFAIIPVRADSVDAVIEALKDATFDEQPLSPERGKLSEPSLVPPASGEPDELE
jgi:hypothetical protein